MESVEHRTENTFWGACHVLCEKLINRFPRAQLVYMGPLHRVTAEETNRHGKVLNDYVEIIKTVTRKYSIPFLDMMAISGIAPQIAVHRELYIPDGFHPNDAGQALTAAKLKGFLESL